MLEKKNKIEFKKLQLWQDIKSLVPMRGCGKHFWQHVRLHDRAHDILNGSSRETITCNKHHLAVVNWKDVGDFIELYFQIGLRNIYIKKHLQTSGMFSRIEKVAKLLFLAFLCCCIWFCHDLYCGKDNCIFFVLFKKFLTMLLCTMFHNNRHNV